MTTNQPTTKSTTENARAGSQVAGLLTVALGGILVALAMGGYLFR